MALIIWNERGALIYRMRLAEATRVRSSIETSDTSEPRAVEVEEKEGFEGFVRIDTMDAMSERPCWRKTARRIDILKTAGETQVVTHRAMDSYASRIERFAF